MLVYVKISYLYIKAKIIYHNKEIYTRNIYKKYIQEIYTRNIYTEIYTQKYITYITTMADKTSSKKAGAGAVAGSSIKKAGAGAGPVTAGDSMQITETESLTTEYHDDYRNLLANYDPIKNKSAPEMTKYELALVIGKRATQIANGAIPLIDVPARMYKVDDIAEEELRQKKTPFIIRRDLGNNKYEYWKVKDMKIP